MNYRIYYIGFAITLTMCIMAFFQKLYVVTFSSLMLSAYLLLAAFYEEKNDQDGKGNDRV